MQGMQPHKPIAHKISQQLIGIFLEFFGSTGVFLSFTLLGAHTQPWTGPKFECTAPTSDFTY